MKQIVTLMVLSVLTLSACAGRNYPPDCAADGANCKQFNSGNPPHPDPDDPAVPNCAADGPGCKQFNPDL